MVHYRLTFSHPERWRDRPVDTSATANKLVPIPAGYTGILEDEASPSFISLS
jgi:hypothetical protein